MIARVLLMTILPVAIFLGGGRALQKWSGRFPNPEGGLGLKWGYDKQTVVKVWGERESPDAQKRLRAERSFLELDLFFPLVYGASLALGMWIGLTSLALPCHPAWSLVPVAIVILADWVENWVQRSQLEIYLEAGADGLQSAWIQIASVATVVKLAITGASLLAIVVMAVLMLVRPR